MFLSCVLFYILAKWLSFRLRTKWFWVRVQLQSLHKQYNVKISRGVINAESSFPTRNESKLQLTSLFRNVYIYLYIPFCKHILPQFENVFGSCRIFKLKPNIDSPGPPKSISSHEPYKLFHFSYLFILKNIIMNQLKRR